jgi:hypothetical protein
LISPPMDFRRASAEALAAARAGADARPWACLALAALQGGSDSEALGEAAAAWQAASLADRPARQKTLEVLALAHLDAGTPHRIFRRAFSLISATPGLWSALLPNLFVATWVQGCFAEGAGPAFWAGAASAVLDAADAEPATVLPGLRRLDEAFFEARSQPAYVPEGGAEALAQGLLPTRAPVVEQKAAPAAVLNSPTFWALAQVLRATPGEDRALGEAQERLAALSAQPQGDAAAQQRWEWAWALGNLVAQRRSGVLPAPGALDARLPELLEVLAEPRTVLEADLFSALIEEIDLWASGLEAPPATLPAPPAPPVATPLAPSAAAPEASPKASPPPAPSSSGAALPPDPPRIPALGNDGALLAALTALEAEAQRATPALRRRLEQLRRALNPLLWLDAEALGRALGHPVALAAPLAAVEPSVAVALKELEREELGPVAVLALDGATLLAKGSGGARTLSWNVLSLAPTEVMLHPPVIAPKGKGEASALLAYPLGAGAQAPAGALAVTAWEGALHWVLPKAEGLEVAEASGEGGDGG